MNTLFGSMAYRKVLVVDQKIERRRRIVVAALALLKRGELVTRPSLSGEIGVGSYVIYTWFKNDDWFIRKIKIYSNYHLVTRQKYLKAKRTLEFQRIPITIKALAKQLGIREDSVRNQICNHHDLKVELNLTKARFVGHPKVFPYKRLRA